MFLSRVIRKDMLSSNIFRRGVTPSGTRGIHQIKYRSMPEVDKRLRLLKTTEDDAIIEDEEKPNKKVLALGITSASVGSAILFHTYQDVIVTSENVGVSMLLIGAGLTAWGSGMIPKGLFEPKSIAQRTQFKKPKFKFHLLNDSFDAEKRDLKSVCGGESEEKWSNEVTNWLKTVEKDDIENYNQEIKKRKDILNHIISCDKPKSIQEALSSLSPKAYVLNYHNEALVKVKKGSDDHRSRAEKFGEEISLILSCATKYDIVVINIESPGGAVSEFGLAASHMIRLKQKGIKTIVTVDKVAASGGFMMACCADEIVAAPFSFLGSIGVVAEVPNVSKVLKKNDIEYNMFTAGKFKRTVSLFAENTQEARDKFQSELLQIHDAFKDHVHDNRGQRLDIEQVATGEAWLAVQCKEYGLVDRLGTSWDIIHELVEEGRDVLAVSRITKDLSPWKRFIESMESSFDEVVSLVKASPLGYFSSTAADGSSAVDPVIGGRIAAMKESSAANRAKF